MKPHLGGGPNTDLGGLYYRRSKRNARIALDQEMLTNIKKLQDEGLHKYVTLNSTVFLLEALTVHGAFNSEPLVQTLHNTIVKHKSFYERFPHLLEVIDRISSQVRSSGVRQEQPQLGQKLKEISH